MKKKHISKRKKNGIKSKWIFFREQQIKKAIETNKRLDQEYKEKIR